MRFYTSVNQYGNKILVRGVNNGKRVQDRISFKPSIYVKSQKESDIKSLFGEPLEKIEFEDINSCKEFVKNYKEVENFKIFGNTNYAYQYITETFPKEVEFDISQIKIWTIDIETTTENGFPNINNPMEEVLLISIQDKVSKEIITFGTKKFKSERQNFKYVYCNNELELFHKFLEYISYDHPHIITGWNIEFFDIPYLCNRIEKMLGSEALSKLSPWKVVNKRELFRFKKTETVFDILGIAVLDYLDLYKKFTYNAQESYKLDHIAKVELGVGKLENPYDSFKEFYTKDWNLFVEYNIVDVERVDQIEDKMRLIELILTMAYDAKCNYVDVFSAVRTWDCILYNHLWEKKIVVHQRDEKKESRSIVGAYVQEPVPGKYDWVVSFDATSLYPSIIMQYNMSPETLVVDPTYFDINMKSLLDGSADLSELTAKEYCMASNGRMFKNDKQGIFPEIVQKLFDDRQKYKKLMLAAQTKYEETKDDNWQKEISKYNNFQMARKIQLNSLFGAWGNEYFRFYDSHIAEGITLTGQFIIQKVGKALDDYLNKICGTNDYNYSFYSDTDSCYVTFAPLVNKFYKEQSVDKIVSILDKICESKIQEVLNNVCNGIADYTNAFDKKIYFKREAIAQTGVFVAKKRYALNVYNNEGVQYAEPKLKVMGLEIVRSSTPEPIRKALKNAVKLALTSTESKLQDFIRQYEKEYRSLKPELIAFPRSVNGMDTYADRNTIYKKATPMHVRGSLLYNNFIIQNNLGKKYELIREADRIKFIYLKEPNTLNENCIAFLGSIPAELNLIKYVDYDMMFSKSFIEPLKTILDGMGWSPVPVATLESLFE